MTDADLVAQGFDLAGAWRGGALLPSIANWRSTLAQAIDDAEMAAREDVPVKTWTRDPNLRENPAWASYDANRTRLAQLVDNARRSLLRTIRAGRADRAVHFTRKILRLKRQLEMVKAHKPRRWIPKGRVAA